jgi:hypothetical protein
VDKHISTWIITGKGRSKGINEDIKFSKAVTDGFQKKKSMLATLSDVYNCLQQNVQQMMNLTKLKTFRTPL